MAILPDNFDDRFSGGGLLRLSPWDQWLMGQQSVMQGSPLPFGEPGPQPPQPPPFADRFGQWDATTTPSGRLPAWQPAPDEAPMAGPGMAESLAVPSRAATTQSLLPGMPSAAAPPAAPAPTGWDRFGRGINDNALILMALGGGIAQGGIGQGLTNAAQIGVYQSKLGSSDDIREFEYAKRQGFAGTFADWMQRKRAGAAKPTFGVVGEDNMGRKTYGFIDAASGTVAPVQAPDSRLDALKDQYQRGFGKPSPELLSPKAQRTLENVQAWVLAGKPPTGGSVTTPAAPPPDAIRQEMIRRKLIQQ